MAENEKEKQRVLNGIFHVTGEPDTGKTTFCLESGAAPEKTLFIDDDVKGRSTVNDLLEAGVKFGKYVDLTELRRSNTEYKFHKKVLELIKGIKPGQYDSIVWDTWSEFGRSFHSYVTKHPKEFKESWSAMGRIKSGEQWREARKYEAIVLNHLASMTKALFVTTHLRTHYVNNVAVPGKFSPDCSPTLEKVSRMRLWLRQNPNGRPVPIALVLKRLDKKFVDEQGRIRTVSVLPRKISPLDEENSLWDTIWNYWDKPVGNSELAEEEMPDAYELSILDGTLTSDQARTFRMLVRANIPEEGIGEEEAQEVKAKEMHEEGKSNKEIADELGVDIPDVVRMVTE